MSSFVAELNNGMYLEPQKNVFSDIWSEYEKVILQSLVTAFGLDFIVKDQYGGDVDTIHNVRQIGKDPDMKYKNSKNQAAYDNRGDYDSSKYHRDPRYIAINRKVSESKKEGTLQDAYTGDTAKRNANIDLDHVVAAKEIHDDRGRVLAGLNGEDLANCEENLKPTDRSINRSMKDKDIDDYLENWEQKRPERQQRISELKAKSSLSDKERKELEKLEKLEQINPDKMRNENKKARDAYEAKLAKAYYTSPQFLADTAKAAGKKGVQMGIRQALGFVFVEIWVAAKEELRSIPVNSELKNMIEAVGNGVKKGIENAKAKYKELLSKLGEGFVAGALSSLTETLCNIFFTTAKNLIKCIRQIYASVVEAAKVLLFNPENLPLGDRIKKTTIILATGASVLVGTAVGELIGATPVGKLPIVGPTVQVFCSTLVSGLLSCSFLIFMDRSKFINNIIDRMNNIPSEVNNYKAIADEMERIAAVLAGIDIAKFREETLKFSQLSDNIDRAGNEEELNKLLHEAYKNFGIKIPWEGDFDSFMAVKTNKLVFQ